MSRVPDMASFPGLTTLDMSNNNITQVTSHDLRFLNNLQELYLGGNEISVLDLNFPVLANLRILSLNNNPLTNLPNVYGFPFVHDPVFNMQNINLYCDQALCPMKDPFRRVRYFSKKPCPRKQRVIPHEV